MVIVLVIVRKSKLFYPYDYNCDAYKAASDGAYNYDFRLTLGFRNAPNDYDARVNRCFVHVVNSINLYLNDTRCPLRPFANFNIIRARNAQH